MDIQSIIRTIRGKENFYQVDIKEFAPEGKWAFQIAKDLGDKMKTAQLLKVFHELKRIQLKQKGKKEEEPFDLTFRSSLDAFSIFEKDDEILSQTQHEPCSGTVWPHVGIHQAGRNSLFIIVYPPEGGVDGRRLQGPCCGN